MRITLFSLSAICAAILLAGCAAHIDAIGEDTITIVQTAGVSDGEVLIKARQGCGLYERVPVLTKIVNATIVSPQKSYAFACAPHPAQEGSLAAYGDAWLRKAQRQAGAP